MTDFDESVFDAMTDEELTDYLSHDMELPLSFLHSAEAVLYASTLLALRKADTLPDLAAAATSFREEYLPIPFDGATLWDDPLGHTVPAKTSSHGKTQETAKPPGESKAAKRPDKPKARASSPAPAAVPAPPPPLPPLSQPVYAPSAAPRQRRHRGKLFVVLLIIVVAVLAALFIGTTLRSMLGGTSPSEEASSTGYTLTWVPSGYTAAEFSDWDVTGYLYTWKNSAGDTITFCRYYAGTEVNVDSNGAYVSEVNVLGRKGEYTRRGREHSLVFSDAQGDSIYYLSAGNVSDSDMQNMIAAIK